MEEFESILVEINWYRKKRSVEERTAADRKMSINRPAAGGESRKVRFFFILT